MFNKGAALGKCCADTTELNGRRVDEYLQYIGIGELWGSELKERAWLTRLVNYRQCVARLAGVVIRSGNLFSNLGKSKRNL